jgi:TonB family protein
MSGIIEPDGPGGKFGTEDDLKSLLDRWIVPETSKSLDQRVINSYYKELVSVDAAAASVVPTLFPQSQKEVVAMKFCSTCREEFADKFSFCPVDGTPLSAVVPEAAAEPATKFVEEPVLREPVASEPVRAQEPLRASAPILAAAGAGAAAFVPRSEFHLTMIDDEGLVGRLVKEVSDVAHQYQLTWPEFKRDPFGFTKRSIVGYGQMLSKFFANRNIVIAMVVAVVAMVAMVVIAGLLDRSQSAGTSRAGIVGFSILAGAFLIGVFATWLRKNQHAAVLGAPTADSNNAVFGVIAAFSVMLLLVGGGVFLNFWEQKKALAQLNAEEQLIADQLIDIPSEQPTPDVGTAGLNKGKGGGSKPKQEKAGGGGGGGREDPKPASFGKTPQASLTVPQVVAPDPKPPTIKNPSLPVAATVVADPMLVPPDARVLPYGDFKSKSMDPSSGPGTGNGIGTGRGGGIGPGDGGGIGPGRGGNIGGGDRNDGGGGPGGGGGGTDYNKVFSGKDVNSKARVLSKPEPQYTEDARKNQVTGTVVLRAVFTSGGQVTNIRAVSGLPFGLTERAIAAARNIRFVPATKDGRPVSMYIQLEYNFNLY